jgi:hypothetical protein
MRLALAASGGHIEQAAARRNSGSNNCPTTRVYDENKTLCRFGRENRQPVANPDSLMARSQGKTQFPVERVACAPSRCCSFTPGVAIQRPTCTQDVPSQGRGRLRFVGAGCCQNSCTFAGAPLAEGGRTRVQPFNRSIFLLLLAEQRKVTSGGGFRAGRRGCVFGERPRKFAARASTFTRSASMSS